MKQLMEIVTTLSFIRHSTILSIHPSIYFESVHQGPYTEAHKPHIHKHIKNKRKSTVPKKRERKWHEVHHVYYKLNCKTR